MSNPQTTNAVSRPAWAACPNWCVLEPDHDLDDFDGGRTHRSGLLAGIEFWDRDTEVIWDDRPGGLGWYVEVNVSIEQERQEDLVADLRALSASIAALADEAAKLRRLS